MTHYDIAISFTQILAVFALVAFACCLGIIVGKPTLDGLPGWMAAVWMVCLFYVLFYSAVSGILRVIAVLGK